MNIYEKAIEAIKEGSTPHEEKRGGVAFLYTLELITLSEYKELIKLLEE